MPSEPSLYERLREAADLPKEARDHWIVLHYNIESTERIVVLTSERLAAIERDMLAPLRDENAALRRAGHTLREAAVKAWIIEDSAALYDAINVWDATVDPEVAKEFPGILAADRAGETPTPKQIEALDDLADDAIRAHHAGETVNIRDITPSPTDAAAKDEDYEPNILIKGKTVAKLKCFDEKTLSGLVESIPDLERWAADTSNELASIREWQAGHQERLADLEQRLDALSPDPTSADWQAGWAAGHEAGYRSGRESALSRGTEVVTDEMIDTFYMHMQWPVGLGDTDQRKRVRAGLEAALRAGGAKK